jgi:hypothetical protein
MRRIAEGSDKNKLKAPYSPPRLISYGDLSQMTLAMFAGKKHLDGGPKGRKT